MEHIVQQAIDNYDLSDTISTIIIVTLLSIIWMQLNVRIIWRTDRWN